VPTPKGCREGDCQKRSDASGAMALRSRRPPQEWPSAGARFGARASARVTYSTLAAAERHGDLPGTFNCASLASLDIEKLKTWPGIRFRLKQTRLCERCLICERGMNVDSPPGRLDEPGTPRERVILQASGGLLPRGSGPVFARSGRGRNNCRARSSPRPASWGLMGLMAPPELGGLGVSFIAYTQIIVELAQHCAALALDSRRTIRFVWGTS